MVISGFAKQLETRSGLAGADQGTPEKMTNQGGRRAETNCYEVGTAPIEASRPPAPPKPHRQRSRLEHAVPRQGPRCGRAGRRAQALRLTASNPGRGTNSAAPPSIDGTISPAAGSIRCIPRIGCEGRVGQPCRRGWLRTTRRLADMNGRWRTAHRSEEQLGGTELSQFVQLAKAIPVCGASRRGKSTLAS